jgi:hypothetical protein
MNASTGAFASHSVAGITLTTCSALASPGDGQRRLVLHAGAALPGVLPGLSAGRAGHDHRLAAWRTGDAETRGRGGGVAWRSAWRRHS